MTSILLGDCDFDKGADGSIGMEDGFRSSKLNRVIIASIYACCDNEIVSYFDAEEPIDRSQIGKSIFGVHIFFEFLDKFDIAPCHMIISFPTSL